MRHYTFRHVLRVRCLRAPTKAIVAELRSRLPRVGKTANSPIAFGNVRLVVSNELKTSVPIDGELNALCVGCFLPMMDKC
jgi:hypothetical protein